MRRERGEEGKGRWGGLERRRRVRAKKKREGKRGTEIPDTDRRDKRHQRVCADKLVHTHTYTHAFRFLRFRA